MIKLLIIELIKFYIKKTGILINSLWLYLTNYKMYQSSENYLLNLT